MIFLWENYLLHNL